MTEIPTPGNELGSGMTSITHEVHGSQLKPEVEVEYDNSYYFQEDPMAIFLVESCLFRIHRHYLIEGSEVFRDMFASPAEGTGPEGTNNKQPISLPGVTKREFKTLLDYFYVPFHKQWRSTGSEEGNLQVYLDLLSISHRFLFDGISQFAAEKLQPMITRISTIQRFILGQKYNLEEWVFSAYESLLDSETTPTAQEFEILGFDKASQLMRARDAMHRSHLQEITAKCKCMQEVDIASADRLMVMESPRRNRRTVTMLMTTQVVMPPSKAFVKRFFGS